MKRFSAIVLVLVMVLPDIAMAQTGEDQAKTRFDEIMKELELKRSSLPMDGLVDLAERLLLEFVEKYPGTKAGGSAHLVLGQLYGSINRPDAAIGHLERYFQGTQARDASEADIARYTLGSVYLSTGDFGRAEKELRAVVARGESADAKILAMAKSTLDRLGTLRKLAVGGEALGFAVKASDGRDISLSAYRGRVVLLDFWASWCAPCRAEMPNVMKVYSDCHEKGFDIIGISMDNSREKFDNYIRQQEIPWLQIFDGKGWQSELGRQYAVISIPATFLLDRKGVIRFKNLRGDELGKAVLELLAEKN